MPKKYDVVIIGGGFFGISIANFLAAKTPAAKILVLEKEDDFMGRASYNNQARVHAGYHYPRSLLTALCSQINFSRFVKQYRPAIVDEFDKYYALANNFSKVSARQFRLFCQRIGAEITDAPAAITELFDPRLIEKAFTVREYAFNAHILKDILVKQAVCAGVDLRTKVEVELVRQSGSGDGLVVVGSSGQHYNARQVFNCTYSLLNKVNLNSGLPPLALKHELAELCLVDLPPALQNISVTVMCGPFFSFMPFPDRSLHTLSHVRYTPHSEWHDTGKDYRDGHEYLRSRDKKTSHFAQMIRDAQRFMPALKDTVQRGSLWEIKTVLQQSEQDDSRPILFKRSHSLRGYVCVMGGKLDNIYDVFRELEAKYA